ncbi:MAG: hypothetical protein ABL921_17180 [Pirellula sp.]
MTTHPCFMLAFSVPSPVTAAQVASLWAIRLAMICMVVVFAAEICGKAKTNRYVVMGWTLGALLALGHSLGALITFHDFNQSEAFESTAQQTEALIGIRVGAGLYVNYIFVAVWLFDAILRGIAPARYAQLPKFYAWAVNGFLVFIAINGAIVFKSGLIRGIGIACVAVLFALWWRRPKRVQV